MNERDRELWDPLVQAAPTSTVTDAARAGLAQEWARVWEAPLEFYQDRFRALGLGPDSVPELDDIPITTKPELQADERAHPPFGRSRSLRLERAIRVGSSTGTTGTPTMIFYGERDLEAHIEAGVRNLWRYGLRPGERFTHSWPQGLYPTSVSGGQSYLRAGLLEISVGPPFSPEIALEQLRVWQLLGPDGFMMTSSQFQLYEEVAAKNQIDLGEMMSGAKVAFLEPSCQFTAPRQAIESAYGLQLFNIGGASEIPGFSVSDCRFHRGLHARGDIISLQACDLVTGREVPAGERGSLVVTLFGVDAFAIRYGLEDVVTVDHGACGCGETGPRYTYYGRKADGVEIDGRLVLPLDVQLAAFDPYGAFNFEVVKGGDPGRLRLRIEADGKAAQIGEQVGDALGVPVDAVEVSAGELPRAAFKPRRVAT